MPDDRENLPFAVASTNIPLSDLKPDPAAFKLEIRRGVPGRRKRAVSELSLEKTPNRREVKAALVVAERLSRGRFKELLVEQGFPAGERTTSDRPVPEDVEQLLGEFVFTSQFAAVRKLHHLIREHGESRALSGALVRGYANLGVMTELNWAPAHKVFKARSLLYAQRMLAVGADDDWARWHRAYAFALTGIPVWAMEDLDAADKGPERADRGQKSGPPAWVPVIDAYARQELSRLEPEKQPEAARPLAHLMRYLLIKQSGGPRRGYPWATQGALEASAALPQCFRLSIAACRHGSVGSWRGPASRAKHALASQLYRNLLAMPDLPQEATKICRRQVFSDNPLVRSLGLGSEASKAECVVRRRLMRVLLGEPLVEGPQGTAESAGTDQAGTVEDSPKASTCDNGEPSWATLGHLIREASFLFVWNEATHLRYRLGVPAEGFIKESGPLVAEHPYRLILDTFVRDPVELVKAQRRAATECPWEDMEPQAGTMIRNLWSRRQLVGVPILVQMAMHYDLTMTDLIHLYRTQGVQPRSFPAIVKNLMTINPRSALARCIRVEHEWPKVQEQAETWAKEFREFSGIQYLLGQKFIADERFEEALACLRAAAKACPCQQTYTAWAKAHYRQGDEDKWLATLEEYLQRPAFDLGPTFVRAGIAQHFRRNGKWQEALRYGEAAAASYAAAGLFEAARCHEALGHWQQAESYYRAASRRYPRSLADVHWYFFCCRTGKGDARKASELARLYLADEMSYKKEEAGGLPAYFGATCLMESQPEKGLGAYLRAFHETNDPYYGMFVALISDRLGKHGQRDAALKRIVKKGRQLKPSLREEGRDALIELAKIFINDLADGEKATFEAESVHRQLEIPVGHCDVNVDYFLGQYFDIHGKSEAAVACWKRCMAQGLLEKINRTLACWELLQRGHESIAPAEIARQPDEDKKDNGQSKPGG